MYSICCLKVIHVMNRKDNDESIYLLSNTLLCWIISIQLPSLSYYMIVLYNLFVDFDIDYNFTMFILFFFPFSLFLLQINADYFSYSPQISAFSTKKTTKMTSSFNVENLLSHLFVQVEANGEEIPSVGQLFLAGRPFALNADWRALHQVGAGNGLTGQDMDEVGT